MRGAAILAAAGAAVVAVVTACGPAPDRGQGPGYLTLLFGRALWEPVVDCRPVDGGVSLDRVAEALRVRGYPATATVVTGKTGATERRCEFTVMSYASWADLDRLRDEFGWTFVSGGATHGDITDMPSRRQVAESCGSLGELEAHGHHRAWGLFGYGNDRRSEAVQRSVVSRCFAFGRRYSTAVNRRRGLSAPWFANAYSVEGGTTPDRLAKAMSPDPGEWRIVQLYRLVEGERRTGRQQWDCNGPGPHWTSRAELSCFEDFLAAVDRIPGHVTVTDPASVAEAWGRADPRAEVP